MTFSKLNDAAAQAKDLLKTNISGLSMHKLKQHHEKLNELGNLLSRTSKCCKDNEELLHQLGVIKLRCKDILHGHDIPTAPRRIEPNLKVVRTRTDRPPATSSPNALAAVG